jgi:hypothetical protein
MTFSLSFSTLTSFFFQYPYLSLRLPQITGNVSSFVAGKKIFPYAPYRIWKKRNIITRNNQLEEKKKKKAGKVSCYTCVPSGNSQSGTAKLRTKRKIEKTSRKSRKSWKGQKSRKTSKTKRSMPGLFSLLRRALGRTKKNQLLGK